MENKENISENEMFYKTICEKYVATMSKEMLLEINNEVLYIFIEDKYIELKDAGKINIDNYKNYLEQDYSEFHYKNYSDLFFQVIKDNIRYDLNDLGVLDLDDKWNFYLTYEELKQIGLGDIAKAIIEEYKDNELIEYDAISTKVAEYFKEKNIENLKDYGEDFNEGLHYLTDLYKDLLTELNINYIQIYTVESEPGEFITTIDFDKNNSIGVNTKNHDDIKYVIHNLNFISNEYKNLMQKENEKANNELDYEIN